ncbi:MAG: hypothetical protein AAB421_05435 [Patescibacteria group bacterium]
MKAPVAIKIDTTKEHTERAVPATIVLYDPLCELPPFTSGFVFCEAISQAQGFLDFFLFGSTEPKNT